MDTGTVSKPKASSHIEQSAAASTLPDPCAHCGVRDRAMCAALNEKEVTQLARHARMIEIAAGDTAFFEGDDAANLFVIVEGSIKLFKLMPDGRRQVTGFLFCGDFLGLAYNKIYQFSAQALEGAKICRLSRTKVEEMIDEIPRLGSRLLTMSSTELAAAQDQMLLLGRKTAAERLASFLVWLSDKAEQRGAPRNPIRLPMSRSDIGDYLGLTVETVSRTMTKFKTSGLIRLKDATHIEVLKPEALHDLAGGEEI